MHSSAVRKKRINIELPETIIEKLDGLARRTNSSINELIRAYLVEKVSEKEKEEMELGMKEGYLENYDFIKESNSEWESSLKGGV
jgi:metal-responsive CopG/Arc/MetJ family transcriptional regulator